MDFKKSLKGFADCLEWHEATDNRKAFTSFTMESMKKDNILHDKEEVLSDVLYSLNSGSDFIYTEMAYCLDYLLNEVKSLKDLQNLDIYEVASEPDAYTSCLCEWLGEMPGNVEYLTEAINNGVTNGFDALMEAQSTAIREVWQGTIDAVIEYLD